MPADRYAESGGHRLAVEVFGEGAVVVYCHGLGGCREHVRQQWASAAGQFRVVLFDQRGHGESSPARDPADYDPGRMAEDIGAVMDSVSLGRAIVGGVSMGACTALRFALAHPERVIALLQTGPAIGPEPCRGREALSRTGRLLEARGIEGTIATLRTEWEQLDMPPEAIGEMERLFRGYDCRSMALAHLTAAEWTMPFEPLSTLRMPVHILAWEGDPVHDISVARQMLSRLPDARMRVIPGVFTPNIGEIYGAMLD